MLNDPVNYIDPLGLNIWHINDIQGAKGAGHAGIIVGSGNDYTYHAFYGKNGTAKGEGEYRYEEFSSLEEAMAYAKEDGYDRFAEYYTSAAEDIVARKIADKWGNKDYLLSRDNCQGMVDDVMKNATGIPWNDIRWPNKNFTKNLWGADSNGNIP